MAPLTVRGLKAALNSTGRFSFKSPDAAVDFLVIGGGACGWSSDCAASVSAISDEIHVSRGKACTCRGGDQFSKLRGDSRRCDYAAVNKSSTKNSFSFLDGGLYYPPKSLKTRLCLRGRHLMYQRCREHNIPYRKTGKLVLARESQRSYVESLVEKSRQLSWPPHSAWALQLAGEPVLPTTLVSGGQARELEPDLSKDITIALWSPETGIIDSHALMESLEKDILESEGGELAYSTHVVRVDPYKGAETFSTALSHGGWVVQTVTNGAKEGDALLARMLINASGLSANLVLNSLLPEYSRIPMYFARGSYAAYSGPGISNVTHLLYPCPETGRNKHAFQSLGTHLTLDLQGRVRFGPNLEWISPPTDAPDYCSSEENVDFWTRYLAPSEARLEEMHEAVTQYLPGVVLEGLRADYVGIRPKLVVSGFQDFVIRKDYADGRDSGLMVSLLGIESPGLTSSLAIAEHVVEDVIRVHVQEEAGSRL